MSIPHPPSIAPPDHQWLTFWLSPSVSSTGSASFDALQLTLARATLARLTISAPAFACVLIFSPGWLLASGFHRLPAADHPATNIRQIGRAHV